MTSLQRVNELLSYDQFTGIFIWKVDRTVKALAGSVAGCPDAKGYRRLKIDGRPYLAHRVAWLIMTGAWPDVQVDHRNGKRSENWWLNLRLATQVQQSQNMRSHHNTNGLKGVYKSPRTENYCARIRVAGVLLYLGTYPSKEEAHAAYCKAAIQHFGEFACNGVEPIGFSL